MIRFKGKYFLRAGIVLYWTFSVLLILSIALIMGIFAKDKAPLISGMPKLYIAAIFSATAINFLLFIGLAALKRFSLKSDFKPKAPRKLEEKYPIPKKHVSYFPKQRRGLTAKLDKFLINNTDILVSAAKYLTLIFFILFFIGLYFANKNSPVSLEGLAVGVFSLDAVALIYYFRTLGNQRARISNERLALINNFFKYGFLGLLGFVAVAQYFKFEWVEDYNIILIIITVFFGVITFYQNRGVIEKVEEEATREQIEEEKRKQEFLSKFPRISKVPVFRSLIKWIYKEGWWYGVGLAIILILFLLFGTHHLGQFMSVDEPKWLNTRIPQLYEAIQEGEWEDTYINDKPGLLPSYLSGITLQFLDRNNYDPLTFKYLLFWWRLPILLFNAIMLIFIYYFGKRLFDKSFSLILTSLVALNPIIIGISQIVNPDATLWSTGFLCLLTFFIYLKTNNKKYAYYSGIFFGLALISKYFAAILYLFLFLAILLEYLIREDFNIGNLYERLLNLLKIYGISIVVYTLLFPATWVRYDQIFQGTLATNILSHGYSILAISILAIFSTLILFKGALINYIKKLKLIDFSYRLLGALALIFIIYLIVNIINNYEFFDLSEYLSNPALEKSFFGLTMISSYTVLMTLYPPLLIGVSLFLFLVMFKRLDKYSNKLPLYGGLLLIIIFVIGSSLGGYRISARYQILLYPIYALISAYTLLDIMPKKEYWFRLLGGAILIIGITTLIAVTPFYYHYNNFLNQKNSVITYTWGFGGYELAQKVNQFPNATKITVWSDQEGFNEFFVGKSYWRGRDNPFKNKDIDYFILTQGGERIFKKALANYDGVKSSFYVNIARKTPILEYYKKEAEFKFCIHDNPSNCFKLVKVDKSDLK